MAAQIEWRSLDVMAAEGMSLRVGSFRASDGELVKFTSDVLRKVFSKVKNPVPMYLTHSGADSGKARTVLGHAVKLGLEADGDGIHYKAIMMDPNFKLMYATGYDDTSAEITPIRDEAGQIIDGELTGIAVVPNPAISGTQMKVSAVAFSAPSGKQTDKPSGGIKLTSKNITGILLESGITADKLDAVSTALEEHFSKKFEQSTLAKKFEEQGKLLELACSERDVAKKKFEELGSVINGIQTEKLAGLVNDLKGMKFSSPETVVAGLPLDQQIITLSRLKENLIASKPAAAPAGDIQAPPGTPGNKDPNIQFAEDLKEMGLTNMWNEVHKAADAAGYRGVGEPVV